MRAYPDPEYNLKHGVELQEDGVVAGFGGPQPADLPTLEYRSRDLEAAFAAADLIVEGRYETQIHCHAPIEPHCCIARFEDGTLTIWDSQQSIFAAREILTWVRVPSEPPRRSHFVKIALRGAWDFALASATVAANWEGGRLRGCRIVLGGVAPTPWRCVQAEEVLEGAEPTRDKIDAAADAALVEAEPTPDSAYRVSLVRQAVAEALREIAR